MNKLYILLAACLLMVNGQGKVTSAQNVKKTYAQIEVEKAVEEIYGMNLKAKLPFYLELLEILNNQNEVDRLLLPLSRDFYTFINNGIIFSGEYNLQNNIIRQSHYEKQPITEFDKSTIKKWIEFCDNNSLYGFDIGSNKSVVIYLKPNIYLLFLPNDYDQQYINKYIKEGRDVRGDAFIRLTENIVVATERR